jgi:hypothetical protein
MLVSAANILPELVVPVAALGGTGNSRGYFIQQVDHVDAEAPAFTRSAAFPIEEIEPPGAVCIYDD